MTHTPRFHEDLDQMCASLLRDGMRLHVASTMSRPNAMLLAVARTAAGRARFTVSSNAFHAHMHALVMADVVSDADTCFAGDTYPSPRPNPLYTRLSEGDPFPVREWSLLSFLQRLVAGANRLPHALTSSLVGSDLAHGLGDALTPLPTPGSGGTALVPALRPDITLVHAPCADRKGNLYFNGPLGEGVWGAMAADLGVVATVERVVEEPPTAAASIPSDRVLAIHVCPQGAHPQGLPSLPEAGVQGYPDDYRHLADLAEACADESSRKEWARRWIEDPSAHEKHRALFAEECAPASGAGTAQPAPAAADEPVSGRETHLVLAARAIAARVRERGVHSLLAGIGMAHVATWLAALLLADEHPVQVHTELGMIDMAPGSGDAFLFSQSNVERCRAFGGTLDVLGTIGTREHALAVLSAAEVDRRGNVNSSRTADGSFLVGSGGANDFSSRMETVIVAPASPRRYVDSARFITSPGHNVRTVVSQFGTLTRTGGRDDFSLSTWLPPADEPGADPVTTLRARTHWPVLDGDVTREPPVSQREIQLLRTLDSEGTYR